MAEWKKVIVSGSSPEFSAISVDGTVTANAFAGDGSGITGISGVSDNNFTTALKNKLDGIATSANNFSLGNATDSTLGGVIVGTGLSVSDGTVSVSQTTANDFTTALKNKLDGVEASADVTDTTNVTSAGALMDTEVTDLAGIKAVTISTLQVKPSEGAFANGDKTKLDGIAAGAEVNPSVGDGGLTQKNFTTTLKTKLDGIAASANNFSFGNGIDGGEAIGVSSGGTQDFIGGTNVTLTQAVGGAITIASANTEYSVGDGGLSQNNFTNADHSKLNGIESSATADQSDAEIRAAVEAATDSNVFTDADHTKLNGIATGAEVNPSVGDGGLTQKNFTTTLKSKLDGIAASANNFSIGVDIDGGEAIGVSSGGTVSLIGGTNVSLSQAVGGAVTITSAHGLSVGDGGLTQNNFTNADHSKLNGIESSATADQTATEIIGLLDSDLGGNFTIGNQSSDTATFTGGVTVSGNLTVSGTTTTVDTANLNVTDQFINLNDGGSAADGGLVVEGAGAAFGWDNSAGRWAFDYSGATEGQTSITSDSFAVTVHNSDEGLTGVNTGQQQLGNVFVDSTNDVIYIYA
jgi:hypothetical protein